MPSPPIEIQPNQLRLRPQVSTLLVNVLKGLLKEILMRLIKMLDENRLSYLRNMKSLIKMLDKNRLSYLNGGHTIATE